MQVTPFENELLNLLKTNNKLLSTQNILLENIKKEIFNSSVKSIESSNNK